MTDIQRSILEMLYHYGNQWFEDLQDAFGVGVSRDIQVLIEQGYIRHKYFPIFGGQSLYILTTKGRQVKR